MLIFISQVATTSIITTVSLRKARFICIERPLMYYRVHEEATTKACIKDNSRAREEAEMFAKMWPKPVVKLLMHYYRRAYEEYE